MLTLIGLGLCDGRDITLRGKEAVDEAQHVYIESYTSLLQCDHEQLEEQLDCTIRKLDRAAIELDFDKIIHQAKTDNVAILVIGDVFGATTHTDMYLRAIEAGVTDGWHKYAGAVDSGRGAVIGIDRFGESAPAGELFKYFGFSVDNVARTVKGVL